MKADDWLRHHFDLAAQASASLRRQYGLAAEERSEPSQRHGGVTWRSATSSVAFSADVWERYEVVDVGVRLVGSAPVDLTCVALGLEPRSVLAAPSRHDRDAGLPAWLERQVGLLATHLTPLLEGDAAFATRAQAAVDTYTSRLAWRLLGR